MVQWSDVFGKELLKLLDSGTEADFTLSCSDGNVRCHRIVLLANGGILAKKVLERLADNVSRLDISRLQISQDNALLILQSLYGGLKDQISASNAIQFLQFAHHFEIQWLISQITERFGTILSPKNVLQLYQRPEVRSSKHLTGIVEEYYSSKFPVIVEEANLSPACLEGIVMLIKQAESHDEFNCFKLFTSTVHWLLENKENTKSAARILSMVPLKRIEMPKLQNEVYDTIFNQLIIGKGDILTQDDKVKLASLYQDAVKESPDRAIPQPNNPEVRVEIFEVNKTLQRGNKNTDNINLERTAGNKSGIINGEEGNGEESKKTKEQRRQKDSEKGSGNKTPAVGWEIPVPGKESIVSYIQSGEWPNMEYLAVKAVIEHDNLLESEFVAVESIFLWIAADHYRKQHCENLLRSCRFSDVCPVYIRCVLNTFVTEKMVGSARLANNILRSTSTPRHSSVTPGRLAGVVDVVPLSVQRLQLGEHALTAKCSSCGERCQVVLKVSRGIPTAVISQLPCNTCGLQRIVHTACSSTLTPDVFPSMYLLPFQHLARLLSSMDDMRLYLFKQQLS